MPTPPITSESAVQLSPLTVSDQRNTPEDAAHDELQSWLDAHGAAGMFDLFRQLAAEVFPPGTHFAFSLEVDPDGEEEAAVCVATLPSGQPDDALACYDRFVAKWARQADPRLSGLFTLLVRSSGDDRP
jgi:hypothetical protein